MLEKQRNKLDKARLISVVFKDFSKDFDSINRNSLVAKLEAYGFLTF